MKLPDRHDRYLVSTATLTGAIIMTAWLFGFVDRWWYPVIASLLLFTGHSLEYAKMIFWPMKK